MAGQKQDDQHEHTYSSYVRIRDVALKTCQRRWTIGRSGERGSSVSVIVARRDDDDDDDDFCIMILFPFEKKTILILFTDKISHLNKFILLFFFLSFGH